MDINQIKLKILNYKNEGKKIFVTSSFQTHSLVLLHIISNIDKNIPIFFINTGFHFSETLKFKQKITNLLKLKVIDLFPIIPKTQQIDENGRFYYTSDPDYCCYINKTQSLEKVLIEYDVWINGIRKSQNENRSKMKYEELAPHNTIRFHPLLDWTDKMIYEYIKKYNLPKHPLEKEGYMSIGCEPCTRRVMLEDSREGRWFGMKKTECGLHTDLIKK